MDIRDDTLLPNVMKPLLKYVVTIVVLTALIWKIVT